MNLLRPSSLLIIFLLFSLSLSGCGDSNLFSSLADDDTSEARLDQGMAAINSGDYVSAITILEALNQDFPADPEVQRYLASAYAGHAGFDTLELIEILSLDDEGVGNEEMFDTIGELFGADDNNEIPELVSKIGDFGAALELLAPDGVTDEESLFQAGLYGAVQSVLLIVDILDGASMEHIKEMSDTEIDTLFNANYADNKDDLIAALSLVAAAANDLGDGNDLADEMHEMLDDIGYAANDIDLDILSNYLKNL